MPHLSDLPGAVREAARCYAPRRAGGAHDLGLARATRFVGAVMDAVAGAGASMPEELPVGPSLFQYSPDREFAKLLLDAGLTEPIVERIQFTHHVDDIGQDFWADILGGTVRTTVLVTTQPPDLQDEIRHRFGELVEPYQRRRLDAPCSVKLGPPRSPPAEPRRVTPDGSLFVCGIFPRGDVDGERGGRATHPRRLQPRGR